MSGPFISFCTTVMNRKHHLIETLPKNIWENRDYTRCEFVILDYNSSDGLEEWFSDNRERLGPKVKFYRYTDSEFYRRSHSRNMAMRLSSGDILCNLDADNFAGHGFASFIASQFSKEKHALLTPSEGSISDTFGKMAFCAEDFHRIRGYNEEIESYGFEDNDLKERLLDVPVYEQRYSKPEFLQAIEHSMQERVRNEEMYLQTRTILVKKIDFKTSSIVLVDTHGRFQTGIIEDTLLLRENDKEQVVSALSNKNRFRLRENELIQGEYYPELFMGYKLILNEEDRNRIIYFMSQLKNKALLEKSRKEAQGLQVNRSGYGKGTVYNLSEKLVLD